MSARALLGSVRGPRERGRPQSSPPCLQLRCRSSAEKPGHQLSLVGALSEASDQSRKRPLHKTVRPVDPSDAQVKVNEVHLDLAPTPEREQRDRVLVARDGPYRARPNVIGDRLEQVVQSRRPLDCVIDDLRRFSLRTLIDLRRSSCTPSLVLLEDLRSDRSLDPAAHRLGVPRQMCQHVAYRPARERRWSRYLARTEITYHGSEVLMSYPASVDIDLGLVHTAIVRR